MGWKLRKFGRLPECLSATAAHSRLAAVVEAAERLRDDNNSRRGEQLYSAVDAYRSAREK